MALPLPKSVAPAAQVAPAAAPAQTTATATKVAIKQFGKARTEPNAQGESVRIPEPKPLGIDLVAMSKEVHDFIKGKVVAAGVVYDDFLAACVLDKPSVPGHKEGKATYAFANMVVSLSKVFGMLTKERSAGGAASLKRDLEKKDNALAALKAKLIALGQSEAEINQILGQ